MIATDPLRGLAAAAVLLLYGAGCAALWWRERKRRRRQAAEAAALLPAEQGVAPVLVAYASQTGQAEELAWQTARALHTAGVPARLRALGDVSAAELAQAGRALLIASSYGEGDPPDAATVFARRVMAARPAPALQGLHYGALALGDRSYAHFCGFGRRLDAWLRECGATPLFERVDVDRADAAALEQWRRELARVAGTTDLPDWQAPAFQPWRLAERRLLNAGSSGAPLVHLELVPADAAPLPDWESGDLLQVCVPADPDRPREYSLASVPAQRAVHLLVRQERRSDGSLGAASGWLTQGLAVGEALQVRLRPHPHFRLGDNAGRPVVFIGNGSGLAGLRAHLHARARSGAGPSWLLYGERQAAFDRPYRDDIDRWLAQGVLARADLVFSRDGQPHRYVQDRLRDAADDLRAWMARGAAVYVCGSLQGMAQGVDAVLTEVLGADTLNRLVEAGRYRRDVY